MPTQTDKEPITINGRTYPLWSQFVHKSDEFKGGVLEDRDMGMSMKTTIERIELIPNGKEHAFFQVVGKDFDCGFCTSIGGVTNGESGWLTFRGFQGHTWRIKKPQTELKPQSTT